MPEKVLIVDDEEDVLRSTKLLVEQLGYEAIALSDPAQVLDVAAAESPGVILQDLRMKDLSLAGYVASLRSDARTAEIPLVFFSASADVAATAAKYDAFGYLSKPFDPKELHDVLDRAMGPPENSGADAPPTTIINEVREAFHQYWNLLAALSNYTAVLQGRAALDPAQLEIAKGLEEVILKLEARTDHLRTYIVSILKSHVLADPPSDESAPSKSRQ